MKKIISLSLLFIFTSFFAHAQDVSYKNINFKYKKGFLVVNNQNVLKLKYSAGYTNFYDLNTGEEIMYIYYNDNETSSYRDDDYIKVYFTKSKKSLETKLHHRILMEKLINEKVLKSDWTLDEDLIGDFIEKYDENFTERTRR
ncbi:MAG: hypothetical protein ACK4RM_09775 [Flavobacterium sp.]